MIKSALLDETLDSGAFRGSIGLKKKKSERTNCIQKHTNHTPAIQVNYLKYTQTTRYSLKNICILPTHYSITFRLEISIYCW